MNSPRLRALLDTNVIPDVLLLRESAEIWPAVDEGRLAGFLPASGPDRYLHVARRLTDATRARKSVRLCLAAFEFGGVDRAVLEKAYSLDGKDFEDDLQVACGESCALEAIVSRDPGCFIGSSLEVWSPAQCCQKLSMGLC